MNIIKNKRKSKCRICGNIIQSTSSHKVAVSREKSYHTYHLRCYFIWLSKRMDLLKEEKKRLNRYKRHMLLEGLE